MRPVVLVFASVLAGSASADEASEIARKAATCWHLPLGGRSMEPAVFTVKLANGELVDATVENYSENQDGAGAFVRSAVNAMMKCAPFGAATGEIRVVMDPKQVPPAGGIDPFKK